MGAPDSSEDTSAGAVVSEFISNSFYPIGTPGKPWTEVERQQWKSQTKIHRSYKVDVLDKLEELDKDVFEVVQYGELSHNPGRYPLFAVKSRVWKSNQPCLLVTGGVHGYEMSGVQGAILFLQAEALKYASDVNIFVAPCVSPWAYEHIQRWNADLKDPNRSFKTGNETEESKALMSYLTSLNVNEWTCHLDLHETTDTDLTEFRPAKHAEAGLMYKEGLIPDGFYLVGDSENPQLEFLRKVVDNVSKVTHIAPPDDNGNIIDISVVSDGIILFPVKELGLCCSFTGGKYVATTEVYPDSSKVTDIICNEAQVATIVGALDFVLSQQQEKGC